MPCHQNEVIILSIQSKLKLINCPLEPRGNNKSIVAHINDADSDTNSTLGPPIWANVDPRGTLAPQGGGHTDVYINTLTLPDDSTLAC